MPQFPNAPHQSEVFMPLRSEDRENPRTSPDAREPASRARRRSGAESPAQLPNQEHAAHVRLRVSAITIRNPFALWRSAKQLNGRRRVQDDHRLSRSARTACGGAFRQDHRSSPADAGQCFVKTLALPRSWSLHAPGNPRTTCPGRAARRLQLTMDAIRHVPQLNHLRHNFNLSACAAHVNHTRSSNFVCSR